MTGVLTGFTVIGVAIFVGYVLARSGVLGNGAHLALNRVSFYAATPALLFTVLSGSDLSLIVSPHMAIAVASFVPLRWSTAYSHACCSARIAEASSAWCPRVSPTATTSGFR